MAAVVLILTGFAGLIIPVIPGIPMMFGGFLLAAWIDGFERIGFLTIFLLGLLTVISVAVDILAAGLGAKKVGASRAAIIGAIAGTVLGLSIGIVGLVVGPFIGAVIGQYVTRSDWAEAGRVGFGTWVGLILGTAVKIGIAFAMIGIFLFSFFM